MLFAHGCDAIAVMSGCHQGQQVMKVSVSQACVRVDFMPYDSRVFALQNTVNRYAAVAGFVQLKQDGLWGSKTQQAVRSALSWISRGSCTDEVCVGDDDAASAAQLVSQWDGTATSAGGMETFLDRVGDTIGLPHIAVPIITAGGAAANYAANALAPLNQPSWLTKLVDAWKSLATWQKIGLGVLFGFGAMWLHKRYKMRKG